MYTFCPKPQIYVFYMHDCYAVSFVINRLFSILVLFIDEWLIKFENSLKFMYSTLGTYELKSIIEVKVKERNTIKHERFNQNCIFFLECTEWNISVTILLSLSFQSLYHFFSYTHFKQTWTINKSTVEHTNECTCKNWCNVELDSCILYCLQLTKWYFQYNEIGYTANLQCH